LSQLIFENHTMYRQASKARLLGSSKRPKICTYQRGQDYARTKLNKQVHIMSKIDNRRMYVRLNGTHHSRSPLPPSQITTFHAKNHPKNGHIYIYSLNKNASWRPLKTKAKEGRNIGLYIEGESPLYQPGNDSKKTWSQVLTPIH